MDHHQNQERALKRLSPFCYQKVKFFFNILNKENLKNNSNLGSNRIQISIQLETRQQITDQPGGPAEQLLKIPGDPGGSESGERPRKRGTAYSEKGFEGKRRPQGKERLSPPKESLILRESLDRAPEGS